jgi:MFS family permease
MAPPSRSRPFVVPGRDAFRALTPDVRILFGTRCARLFAYGFLSVVLVLYLSAVGLSDRQIGLLLMMTLLGDTVISLGISTTADRTGRRKMLVVGGLLMACAGGVFALTSSFWWLLLAATIGVISPSGHEVGPFLSIEQAALSQLVPEGRRVKIFAWYNLVGSVATALGALCGGGIAQVAQWYGLDGGSRYRPLVVGYASAGLVLAWAFIRLSPAAEVARPGAPFAWSAAPLRSRLGLLRSFPVVLRLAGLFALDAFGGGFVVQSIMAYWFYLRFGVEPATIGAIFFGANLLAGASALSAAWVARRIGLVRTMVFTHLPSNLFLILVPLMPSLPLAILVLLLRFSISQMDVPTRQAYTMAVVAPEERSAAAGVTGVARSLGAAISPLLATMLVESPALMSVPFFLSGGIKIVYDLLLYWNFVGAGEPDERPG